MDRGIIIAPDFTYDAREQSLRGLAGIDTVNLRFYLLYWDKIEYPSNNIINIGCSPDQQYLIDAAVMSRTQITLRNYNGDLGFAYVLAQSIAVQQKNQREPGQWALAQSSNQLVLHPAMSTESNTIEVEFFSALPTPGDNVSLDDILTFKQRRQSELRALRSVMDELYLETVNSADIPRGRTAAMNRLEKAIMDLHSLADESWASKLLSGLKVDLNLPSLAWGAATGAGLAQVFGFPAAVCAIVGAAWCGLKFEFTVAPKVNGLPPDLLDYAYIHSIEKEFRT